MSTPSPLVPEGAIPPSKGKSNVKIAIFTILAIHVVLLGGLLIQGCKPSGQTEAKQENAPAPQLQPMTQSAEINSSSIPVADTSFPVQEPMPATAAPATATVPTPAPNPVAVTPLPATVPATVSTAPVAEVIPATVGEMKVHSVAKGEMLSTIARKYQITVKALQDANPTVNPTKLQINQKLNIPAPVAKAEALAAAPAEAGVIDGTTYTVKPGDALEKIARANKTTVKAIKALNNLRTDRIAVGQKLKLPAGKEAAAIEAAPEAASVSAPVPAVVVRTASR